MLSEISGRFLVFDGHCYICSGWARFLQGRTISPPFDLVTMQSERGKRLLAQHGIDPEDPATFLVVDHQRAMTESDAAIHVIVTVGGWWRVFSALRIIPKPWRDAMYRLLARNRYRWFGRREVCYLP
jgi:predicted DCC family thiol-disulfide oxidoreductase YuxK